MAVDYADLPTARPTNLQHLSSSISITRRSA
jgi:hypothetical protein